MNLRKWTGTTIRLAICAAALALAFRGVAAGELAAVWQRCDKSLLAAGLAIFLATPLLQALRLHWLLAARGVRLDGRESVRLAFVGNFLNYAVPLGSTAGDVYKAVAVGRRAPRSVEAATIVLIDRAIGLATLLLSVTLIAWLAGSDSKLAVIRNYLLVLSAILAGAAAIAALPLSRSARVREWIARLPKGEMLVRVLRTTRELLTAPRALLTAALVTLGIQIAAAAAFLCVALALHFDVTPDRWPALYAFFSTGEIVKALPGPPQGMGTMELAYGYLFADWAGPSQILSAALGIRIVGLLCSLPGAAMLATRRATTGRELAAPTPALALAPNR